MMFQSLRVTTDFSTENSLLLTAVCRQILFARTTTVKHPVNNDALKNKNDKSIVNQGAVSTVPSASVDIPMP